MTLLEQFAAKYGLNVCTLQIRNRIHFNPDLFPGREPEDGIIYESAIEGKPSWADDPEAVTLYIVDPSCPLADGESESPEGLVFLRWDIYGKLHTHPFSTTDMENVEKVLIDLGLKGER